MKRMLGKRVVVFARMRESLSYTSHFTAVIQEIGDRGLRQLGKYRTFYMRTARGDVFCSQVLK